MVLRLIRLCEVGTLMIKTAVCCKKLSERQKVNERIDNKFKLSRCVAAVMMALLQRHKKAVPLNFRFKNGYQFYWQLFWRFAVVACLFELDKNMLFTILYLILSIVC